MTYPQTLQYLYEQLPMFHRIGAAAYKADLGNTLQISQLLGMPENKYKSVHIAGTNGKGSTSHFLASILQEAGYKTGLFTSPHLKDFRERIRVNGKMIPKSEVTHFVRENRNAFDAIQPSFFEWTFGLASWYFAKEKIDVAIMETGMGGRLDSTNIITPVVSVITNISLDHMQFLGDSPEKIAAEKAGIIKPGVPVVIGETQPGPEEVFRQKATVAGTTICFADNELSVLSETAYFRRVPLLSAEIKSNDNAESYKLTSPLTGHYQLKNLLTVLQTIRVLRQKGWNISDMSITKGIRKVVVNTGLRGRWQVLSRNPVVVTDIGHNKDGIKEVVKQIGLTPHDHLHFVLGVVNDKDVDAMLTLLPPGAEYYFCKADIPRGLDASLLREKANACGLKGNSYESVKKALEAAKSSARHDDLIVIGGSAFVVAEVV